MKDDYRSGFSANQAEPPSVTAEAYRETLRRFASGVTIVTIRCVAGEQEQVHGLTVSAFASLSQAPPLVAVMIDRGHHAHALLETPGASFAVNMLGSDQQQLSDRFAWVTTEDRFAEGKWVSAVSGAPVLADALAWLDCCVHARCAAGTHTIYVGRVLECQIGDPVRKPLLYWDRAYRGLAEAVDA